MKKNIYTISTDRFESFSDGIICIIITLMVFQINIPKINSINAVSDWKQLAPVASALISYALSFTMLGVLWVNHHHFCHQFKQIDRALLWYNLHLLFWLSIIPIPTAMLGSTSGSPVATALYGFVMFMCAVSFALMREHIHKNEHLLVNNISSKLRKWQRLKIRIGILLYFISIFVAFISVYASFIIFIAVAAMYFFPSNIELEQEN